MCNTWAKSLDYSSKPLRYSTRPWVLTRERDNTEGPLPPRLLLTFAAFCLLLGAPNGAPRLATEPRLTLSTAPSRLKGEVGALCTEVSKLTNKSRPEPNGNDPCWTNVQGGVLNPVAVLAQALQVSR